MKISPTKPQLTYLLRTLMNYGGDSEKIAGLDRSVAGKVIGDIEKCYATHRLDPKYKYSSEEVEMNLNNRNKAIRKIKDFYAL